MTSEQYTELLETLAEKCAEMREKERDQRRYLQRDPDIQRRNGWHAQSAGYMKALAESLRELQYTPEQRFDPQDFAEWCWRQHQHTNEWRTEAAGITEQAAKGWHNGFGFALDAIKENSDVEHEDFADSFEVATA
jgi:hypothetical protein